MHVCLNIKDYSKERENLQYTKDLQYIKLSRKDGRINSCFTLEMVKVYIKERIY